MYLWIRRPDTISMKYCTCFWAFSLGDYYFSCGGGLLHRRVVVPPVGSALSCDPLCARHDDCLLALMTFVELMLPGLVGERSPTNSFTGNSEEAIIIVWLWIHIPLSSGACVSSTPQLILSTLRSVAVVLTSVVG